MRTGISSPIDRTRKVTVQKNKTTDDSSDIAEEEIALFRKEMANTNRYPRTQHAREKSKPKPDVTIRKAISPEPARGGVMIDNTDQGNYAEFARDGLQKKVIRKLKRGEYRFADILDLHGHTTAEAEPMLTDFVLEASDTGKKVVLIIHGKGLRSGETGGVLKRFTQDWLKQQSVVNAFCSAIQKDGGTGAVYVLLRSSR